MCFVGKTGVLISPTIDINLNETSDNSGNDEFTFVIPVDDAAKDRATREIVDSGSKCVTAVERCEFFDEDTGLWSSAGCSTEAGAVSTGLPGMPGTRCRCNHLTVFAVVMRARTDPTAFCQATPVDYALIACYSLCALLVLWQFLRAVDCRAGVATAAQMTLSSPKVSAAKIKQVRKILVTHLLLFAVCILRILYLALKPLLEPMPGMLVGLALFPSFIQMTLFLNTVFTWASISFHSMKRNPFTLVRKQFIASVASVFFITVTFSVVFSLDLTQATLESLAFAASSVLAAL